jgi:hypothetical protein
MQRSLKDKGPEGRQAIDPVGLSKINLQNMPHTYRNKMHSLYGEDPHDGTAAGPAARKQQQTAAASYNTFCKSRTGSYNTHQAIMRLQSRLHAVSSAEGATDKMLGTFQKNDRSASWVTLVLVQLLQQIS